MLGFTHLQSENSTVILSAHYVGTLKAGAKTINQGEEIPLQSGSNRCKYRLGCRKYISLIWFNLEVWNTKFLQCPETISYIKLFIMDRDRADCRLCGSLKGSQEVSKKMRSLTSLELFNLSPTGPPRIWPLTRCHLLKISLPVTTSGICNTL